MLRSLSRRLRRTLSFRSRSKYRGKGSAAAGGGTGAGANWENDSVNIKASGGCSFPAKYLGCLEVSESRGTQICSQAAHQMKMSSAGKKKHRVTLWVTEDTLRVIDDETKSLVVDQVIEKVSFCTPDPHDEKLFSYICRDGTSRRWLCHSFKGIKDTGERISHAVGCAFAACLAKKQQQNQQNQNFQRGNSTRKTLESRPNGVKLPPQSVETLAKLNQDDYNDRVQKANVNMQITVTATPIATPSANTSPEPSSPVTKQQVSSSFARPRPSASTEGSNFTRHHSLPYRAKKTTGSSTYQALTEDPLPPRIPATPERLSPNTNDDEAFWLDNSSTQNNINQSNANPFNNQLQGNFQSNIGQQPNPFSQPVTNANPFNEKFV